MNWHTVPAAHFSEHAAHAESWRRLHAGCGAPVLLSYEFVAPLVERMGAGGELLAWCERAGEVVAMALVAPAGRASWSTFQPPQAPLGLWLQRPDLQLAPLLAGLLRALPGFPLVFALTQMDPALAPRPDHGASLDTLDYIDTARVTLAGPFDAYWQARGKNLRANLKKHRARLARDGIAPRLEISRAPQDMARAVEDYGRLEQAGWKAGEGTAVHPSNAQGRYYRAMLELLAARGCASVFRYYFGDRLVAMDLCVEDADSIVVLKTSYDEGAADGLSPALLMREEASRFLFDGARLARIEFYGRVMDWHLRWTDEVRTMYHVNYYRWPGLRRLRALLASRSLSASAPVPSSAKTS
ncbi:GNAT family N-acetyltransferase [uncultured Massilia sp.]|uniref:GNAT family N-acetyltransferase n=1 Tax=uncultured Massilia sp. TaxID=169973 RepID=UPI0025845E27|nr:GNAT family N-acetyltransferase [uncultured Massilia sp.]